MGGQTCHRVFVSQTYGHMPVPCYKEADVVYMVVMDCVVGDSFVDSREWRNAEAAASVGCETCEAARGTTR
jgi:hypothetical protein